MPFQPESQVYVPEQCPACESRAFRSRPVPRRWIGLPVFEVCAGQLGLAECVSCGVVLTRPRPSSALLADFYGGDDYRCHGDADRDDVTVKADVLLDRVERTVGLGMRLLDYGCGSGWLLQRARQRGWTAVGYDMGARAIETCRAQGIDVVADLDLLCRERFDAIVLHHVFEHLEQPRQTLRRLRELLSPEGRLCIEVPNSASLRARLSLPWLSRLGVDERYRAFPIHLFYFTPRSLERLLASEGFDVALETYGVGIDELVVRSPARRSGSVEQPAARRSAAWRKLVKRVLFGADLGENILALARLRSTAA